MLHFHRIPKVLGPGGWFPNVTRPRGASRKPRGRRKPLEEASRGCVKRRGSREEGSRSLGEPRGASRNLEEPTKKRFSRSFAAEKGSAANRFLGRKGAAERFLGRKGAAARFLGRKGAAKIHVSSGLSRKPRGSLEEPREILEEASRKA
eukprot:gene9147-biopygen6711